jgi:hypothetical protein
VTKPSCNSSGSGHRPSSPDDVWRMVGEAYQRVMALLEVSPDPPRTGLVLCHGIRSPPRRPGLRQPVAGGRAHRWPTGSAAPKLDSGTSANPGMNSTKTAPALLAAYNLTERAATAHGCQASPTDPRR